ncbi:aminoglycoside phosphotransferase [Maritimibacter sp. 55A14]|uniref:aminoglycoside phosphotransferase family protein n=1 Tax=Maritimibacter sp. 55A14 TaxID=2174844 RepID=UPI000D607987|nr:phosphotransferase [Maritimibacter sp. 55A14]PWE33468.1 aminoglycoside phosphotransferase [Maritimibacter sp. 55A14]
MTDRAAQKSAFLRAAGWDTAVRSALAGDASARGYDRLSRADGQRAVLMDAPPERGEDVRPFTRIARHLRDCGLSAPAIMAEDTEAGFLLLEDLGDAVFARVAVAEPAREAALYAAAADALAVLQAHAPPGGLPHLDAATLGRMTAPVFEWYAPDAAHGATDALAGAVAEVAGWLDAAAPVLVLRDFHAENLIWLPDRAGPARVGLLDFQDAVTGHPAYDLVSLLEDARRDLGAGIRAATLARFAAATGADPRALEHACAVLGAQRNLRILGIFARLALRDGKPEYLDLLPRVWQHLRHDLAHPALAGLRALTDRHIPEPDAARRAELRERCNPTA